MGGVGAATVYGDRKGMVKIVGDRKYGELLGAHIVGVRATEMIAELVVAKQLEGGYAGGRAHDAPAPDVLGGRDGSCARHRRLGHPRLEQPRLPQQTRIFRLRSIGRSSTSTSARHTRGWPPSASTRVLPEVPVWQPILLGASSRSTAGTRGRGLRRARGRACARSSGAQPSTGCPRSAGPTRGRATCSPPCAPRRSPSRSGSAVAFSLAAFRQAFAGGRDLSDPDNVLIAAAACELHPRAVLKGDREQSVKDALRTGDRGGAGARRHRGARRSRSASSSSGATIASKRPPRLPLTCSRRWSAKRPQQSDKAANGPQPTAAPAQALRCRTWKTARALLDKMLLIRHFEERAQEMYVKAKIGGFLHLASARRPRSSAPPRRSRDRTTCSPPTASTARRSRAAPTRRR